MSYRSRWKGLGLFKKKAYEPYYDLQCNICIGMHDSDSVGLAQRVPNDLCPLKNLDREVLERSLTSLGWLRKL